MFAGHHHGRGRSGAGSPMSRRYGFLLEYVSSAALSLHPLSFFVLLILWPLALLHISQSQRSAPQIVRAAFTKALPDTARADDAAKVWAGIRPFLLLPIAQVWALTVYVVSVACTSGESELANMQTADTCKCAGATGPQ